MPRSDPRVDLLFVGLLVLHGTWLWLTANHLIVDGDEAKYYTTIREVVEGKALLLEVLPGSAGYFFYHINAYWAKIFGVGYETGRYLNVLATLLASAVVLMGLRQIFSSAVSSRASVDRASRL